MLLSDHFTIYTHCTPLIYTVLYFSYILKLEKKKTHPLEKSAVCENWDRVLSFSEFGMILVSTRMLRPHAMTPLSNLLIVKKKASVGC